MKTNCAILSLALASSSFANDALDLLAADADNARSVFEEAAQLPSSGKQASTTPEKKKHAEVDVQFPTRWRNQLLPRLELTLPGGTVIAPRALLEYQNHDRSIARNSRLSRSRIGAAIATYYGIEILADALISSDGDFQGWENLRASIPLNDQLTLAAGKFPPPFSIEYTRDAAARWFPTLSPLASQLAPASSLGLMVESSGDTFDWKLGWFSSDADRRLPSLNGSGYILAGASKTSNLGGTDDNPSPNFRRWHLDYIYNIDGATSESINLGYRHLLSAGTQYSSDKFDFYTEFLAGRSSDNTTVGITAAGAYWLLQDAVRLVGRYQYAVSREPGGVLSGFGIPDTGSDAVFPSDFPVFSAAEKVSSIYGGINIHLDDDHFIIGTGLEYRSLTDVVDEDDFSSWGWNTFARFAF